VLACWQQLPEFGSINRDDVITAVVNAFTYFGIRAPAAALSAVFTSTGFPRDFEMPTTDRKKLRLVLLEVMRLNAPISGTCVKLKAPLTCPFKSGSGKQVIFRYLFV